VTNFVICDWVPLPPHKEQIMFYERECDGQTQRIIALCM